MSDKLFTHIDLFTGAGGLSECLSETGFHSLFANEVLPVYASTYARNHIGAKVATNDIRSIDADKVKEDLGFNWENVSKRIIPQIIYKGQVLQREDLCRSGLYLVYPKHVNQESSIDLGEQRSYQHFKACLPP